MTVPPTVSKERFNIPACFSSSVSKSGDEGHFLKSKKTPRIGNTDMKPENSGMGRYFNLEDSEVATVTKQDGEGSSQADISPVDESTNGPTKEPRQLRRDPVCSSFPQIIFPESNHQKAENVQCDEPLLATIWENRDSEDQKQNEFLITEMDSVGGGRVLLLQEQDNQSPLKSTDGSHYIAAGTFNNTPQEMGSITPVQERTNKEHLSEGMTNTLNGKNPESKNLESGSLVEMEMNYTPMREILAVGSHSQKEAAQLSTSTSIIQQNRPLPDRRATHEADIAEEEVETSNTYGLTGGLYSDDFHEGQRKSEESSSPMIPSNSNLTTSREQSIGKENPCNSAIEQGGPDNVPQSNKTNQNVKLSYDSQESRMSRQESLSYSCPTDTDSKVIIDISGSKEKAQVTKISQPISGSTGVPLFSNRNSSVKVLLEGTPYSEKDGKDREEAGHEGEPSEGIRLISDHSAFLISVPKNLIPKAEHRDTIILALEKENPYLDMEQKQVTTSPAQKEVSLIPATRTTSPWLTDLVDEKEPGLGVISGRSEQNPGLKESSLSVSTTCLFMGREIIAEPVKETETNMNSGKSPSSEKTGLSESGCNSKDHTDWGESLALELDFLPDSQIRDALDDPNFGFPSEQSSGVENTFVPSLPRKNPHPDEEQVKSKVPMALKNTSSHNKLQCRDEMAESICDPPREDATAIVCGLTVELSNLNRLIMSTHRDLESFRRLKHRKGKVAGKQSPYQLMTHCSHPVKKW
ncbi:break repair meiotic recombinase recruitment factor 1 isoform X2 [Petaurus breviceps papuanus]|uniref:break repair meiotic recombinase recruitment factor 1 isoform X2 n=1 Tax=Petaurus breviceps papuanus TaxID=3040969 RepID=UPI0036DF41CB